MTFDVRQGNRYYGCAKRGCDKVNPAYLSFGARGKGWCLNHVPWYVRLSMWLRRVK